mmetsp:Transcript_17204/g.56317  ORF Transcript_17204/g.56317 Transcript_17204/m.56317 type:complete len:269 (+) Transcript_17204:1857-2663(+)
MHQVRRGLLEADERGYRLEHNRVAVLKDQRNGALAAGNRGRRTTSPSTQRRFEKRSVPKSPAHQQKLRPIRSFQDWHLPRPPALGIFVKVKLVNDDKVEAEVRGEAQHLVRQHLRRAAQNRSVRVDARVARDEAHILGAKLSHELEKLFRNQSLQRRRVDAGLTTVERQRNARESDQRLARTSRGGQKHVAVRIQAHDCLLLPFVQLDSALRCQTHEALEEFQLIELIIGHPLRERRSRERRSGLRCRRRRHAPARPLPPSHTRPKTA